MKPPKQVHPLSDSELGEILQVIRFGDQSNLAAAVRLFFKEHNTQSTSEVTIAFRLSKNLPEVENTPK